MSRTPWPPRLNPRPFRYFYRDGGTPALQRIHERVPEPLISNGMMPAISKQLPQVNERRQTGAEPAGELSLARRSCDRHSKRKFQAVIVIKSKSVRKEFAHNAFSTTPDEQYGVQVRSPFLSGKSRCSSSRFELRSYSPVS